MSRLFFVRAALSAAFAGLLGCASAPPRPASAALFYPQAPDEPRLQLLASYSAASDLAVRHSALQDFIVGKPEEKPIVKPYGFDFWQERIYLCDTALATLVVLDLESGELRYLPGAGPARLVKPINLAIDRDGTKYVADTGRGAVLILDAEDRYAGELTRKEGMKPVDVAIAGDLLYVADLQSRRVSVWDKKRKEYLRAIPAEGESAPEARLFSPVNLALDREGNLYVSDLGAFRVQKYDPAGRYLRSFGTLGSGPGQLVRPKGIELDEEGRLYVVDAATEVVQIFDPQGRLLLFFGEPREDGSGLSLPAKVRISRELVPRFQHLAAPSFALEYLVLVSSQYGDRKLSVFGFGANRP